MVSLGTFMELLSHIIKPAKAEIKDFYFRGRIYRSKIFFQRFFYAHVFIINQLIKKAENLTPTFPKTYTELSKTTHTKVKSTKN